MRFAKAQTPIQLPGEHDSLMYIPLGVGAVIPPWNFPCAIMAGMTLASIVSGNTVILKPSSDSPTIAAKFIELLEEAGMPEGVVNFCPGAGASFGDAVVAHPKTRYIGFYRLARSRPAHQQDRLNPSSRPGLDQTDNSRNGGQRRHHRRRRCRLSASAVEGVAQAAFGVSRTKMFGLLAVPSSTNASTTSFTRAAESPRRGKFKSAM